MNRRDFIQHAGVLSLVGAAGLNWSFKGLNSDKELLVIHTNDVHSRLDPFPMDGGRFQGRGGLSKRASVISALRKEHKQVLLLDAGDIFQGTPYFNLFKGEPEIKAMSSLGYDAATIGNHDYDAGIDGFDKQLPHASFPFLCSNYDFSNTVLDGKTKNYQIFQKGKLKIGVFGLGIELNGLVPKKLFKETVYLDPVELSQDMVRELKENCLCDLIVCLSHLGYSYRSSKISDRALAEKVSGIDLIIGGHTHTFLRQPEIVSHKSGHKTLVNQVGWAGLNLGVIQFKFNRLRNKEKGASNNLQL